MTSSEAQKRIAALRAEVASHDELYYRRAQPGDQRPGLRPPEARACRPRGPVPGRGKVRGRRHADRARGRRPSRGIPDGAPPPADAEPGQHLLRGRAPRVSRPPGAAARARGPLLRRRAQDRRPRGQPDLREGAVREGRHPRQRGRGRRRDGERAHDPRPSAGAEAGGQEPRARPDRDPGRDLHDACGVPAGSTPRARRRARSATPIRAISRPARSSFSTRGRSRSAGSSWCSTESAPASPLRPAATRSPATMRRLRAWGLPGVEKFWTAARDRRGVGRRRGAGPASPGLRLRDRRRRGEARLARPPAGGREHEQGPALGDGLQVCGRARRDQAPVDHGPGGPHGRPHARRRARARSPRRARRCRARRCTTATRSRARTSGWATTCSWRRRARSSRPSSA